MNQLNKEIAVIDDMLQAVRNLTPIEETELTDQTAISVSVFLKQDSVASGFIFRKLLKAALESCKFTSNNKMRHFPAFPLEKNASSDLCCKTKLRTIHSVFSTI